MEEAIQNYGIQNFLNYTVYELDQLIAWSLFRERHTCVKSMSKAHNNHLKSKPLNDCAPRKLMHLQSRTKALRTDVTIYGIRVRDYGSLEMI